MVAKRTARDALPTVERAMRALSDGTRIKLLLLLATRGEQNVTELGEGIRAGQPSVSHHLGILRSARLVRSQRRGRAMYYRIADGVSWERNRLQVRTDGVRITVQALSWMAAGPIFPALLRPPRSVSLGRSRL